MIINYLNLVSITVLPAKNHSPLIIDTNRVKTFQCALQRFQSIPRRLTKVADLRSVVQVEKFSTGDSYQVRRKSQDNLRSPIVEKVFCKLICKGFDHETMLSNLDNYL